MLDGSQKINGLALLIDNRINPEKLSFVENIQSGLSAGFNTCLWSHDKHRVYAKISALRERAKYNGVVHNNPS